ncbi:MAG TPA: arginine--tRNA ligase [Candidatus Saccharimonadales bacterium]|nr:arginine--tRNA ligase [Candidatus Saccharimonadales bacterium]
MTDYQTYEDYREDLQKQIKGAVVRAKIGVEAVKEDHESAAAKRIREEIDNLLEKHFSQSPQTDTSFAYSAQLVSPPKNAKVGWTVDYALPTFAISRQLGRNPVDVAGEIADCLKDSDLFARVETSGPYVNIGVKDSLLLESLNSLADDPHYGQVNDHQHELAVIDYSSPNVAKPFGVNHLRTTIIGESLSRIFEAVGYTVVRDNHLGDWGTQFGNLLAAHAEYAPEIPFSQIDMDTLNRIYVRFSQEMKTSDALKRKGQEYFSRLEKGDALLMENWVHALKLSLAEFQAMYDRLGVKFDTFIGEAYYVNRSYELIANLPKEKLRGLVEFSDESPAVVINGQHPVVVITGDGYGVYAARDLATVDFRVQEFKPEYIFYVVGEEQASYFQTIFEVAKQAGLTKRESANDTELEFIGFGLLLDKDGKKLSTRKGTSGKLEDVLDAVELRATEETKKRNPELDDNSVRLIARKVSVGAVIWNDLKADRVSSVRFDIDRMLELGGDSVVDILYTFSRSTSILNKLSVAELTSLETDLPKTFSSDHEHRLALKLSEFSIVIKRAAAARSPHILAGYLSELAQLHGRFYEESRVIGIDDKALAAMRILLHRAYVNVISSGLSLMNIPVTDRL